VIPCRLAPGFRADRPGGLRTTPRKVCGRTRIQLPKTRSAHCIGIHRRRWPHPPTRGLRVWKSPQAQTRFRPLCMTRPKPAACPATRSIQVYRAVSGDVLLATCATGRAVACRAAYAIGSKALLSRGYGSRRCACCQRGPGRLASAPGCCSRGGAAAGVAARVAAGRDDEQQPRARLSQPRNAEVRPPAPGTVGPEHPESRRGNRQGLPLTRSGGLWCPIGRDPGTDVRFAGVIGQPAPSGAPLFEAFPAEVSASRSGFRETAPFSPIQQRDRQRYREPLTYDDAA
jgi:hypothetical protein